MAPSADTFLPYGRQVIDEDDIAAVVATLRGDWLTGGPAVAAFEEALSVRCDQVPAVAVANGTAALHLALAAIGLKSDECVIVPSVTFLATANAARLVGAEVVFADVDAETGLLTAESCQDAIARADAPVRAILPVHLGGRLVDVPAIRAIADDIDAAVIEDGCHALGGAFQDGSAVGGCAHSDMTTFSFHPVKTVAAGEGGAVMCRSGEIAERVHCLRNHGMIRTAQLWKNRDAGFTDGATNPWYYEMQEVGLNYRMTDIQCALATSQMKKLDSFVTARDHLARCYDQQLAQTGLPVVPIPRSERTGGAWHLYQVAIDFSGAGISRATLMHGLRERGIGTQVHYIPVHGQPYYRERYGNIELPGAMHFYERSLSLPLFPAMREQDVSRVVEALTEAFAELGTRHEKS